MEQKINIAELLKDCPKGTKLYSPIFGECEFVKLDKSGYGYLSIFISVKGHNLHYSFDKYGCYLSEFSGECLLFPSKKVREWGCFKTKYAWGEKAREILAKHGGIDNGEIVEHDYEKEFLYIDAVTHIIESCGGLYDEEQAYIISTGTELKFEEEPKCQFKPFDKVVVRNFNPENEESKLATNCYWFAAYFSHYNKKDTEYPYVCTCNDSFPQCLPYNEQTAKLIGTTDSWEE